MNPLTILPRSPKENNREYAYRLLRYNIMTLVLEPGTSLNEIEIAELLKISRTPVHEALFQLKSHYLVDILPQSGTFISYISIQNIREGLFMRSTLEPAIYQQLAGSIEESYLIAMKKNLEEASQIILSMEDDSLDRLIKLDDSFHKIAYDAAHKPILWSTMKTVCSHFERIRYQENILVHKDMKHIYEEHQVLYEYLLIGGTPGFDLVSFYESHLSYFKGYFSELLEKYPEYFRFQ